MARPLRDQSVVVIGASSGIGRATATTLARRGANVVCAARGVRALDTLIAEITTFGGSAIAVPTDISDPAAVAALADRSEDYFGRIDTWINLAAVAVWGRIDHITDEEFDRVMRVNFLGQVHGVHAALPALRRAGGGTIIGIASMEAIRAVPMHAPYTASKWAVRAFYDVLRMELAQEGAPIAVCTILPAAIDTPFFEHSRNGRLGVRPKPPAPVYAPQIVADAIVHTIEHPQREVAVGGSAVGLVLGQRLFPALVDAALSLRRFGVGWFLTDRPDSGRDNVDAPVSEPGQVHGNHPGRVWRRSLVTQTLMRLPRPGDLVTGALARLHRGDRPHRWVGEASR